MSLYCISVRIRLELLFLACILYFTQLNKTWHGIIVLLFGIMQTIFIISASVLVSRTFVFPPLHFILLSTSFTTLFPVFLLAHHSCPIYSHISQLSCISINNYSFHIRHFIHLHSSNLPLTSPFPTYADNKKPPPVSDPSTVIYSESNSDNF